VKNLIPEGSSVQGAAELAVMTARQKASESNMVFTVMNRVDVRILSY
jgi:hypothetical protein